MPSMLENVITDVVIPDTRHRKRGEGRAKMAKSNRSRREQPIKMAV